MDIADIAAPLEELDRAEGVANVLAYDPGTPVMRNGVRCCADCADPISLARLDAFPRAVRCAECQSIYETRNKRDIHGRR